MTDKTTPKDGAAAVAQFLKAMELPNPPDEPITPKMMADLGGTWFRRIGEMWRVWCLARNLDPETGESLYIVITCEDCTE